MDLEVFDLLNKQYLQRLPIKRVNERNFSKIEDEVEVTDHDFI